MSDMTTGAARGHMLIAIDPGHTHSAYVQFHEGRPIYFTKCENAELIDDLRRDFIAYDDLVIEQVACMGMAVGAEVFETVFWSGRFCQLAELKNKRWHRIKRHEVKMHLCGNMRAKDANIRQALIDRYGPGKDLAIGKKASPGPLYGMSGDCWAALSVAVTFADQHCAVAAGPGGGGGRTELVTRATRRRML